MYLIAVLMGLMALLVPYARGSEKPGRKELGVVFLIAVLQVLAVTIYLFLLREPVFD